MRCTSNTAVYHNMCYHHLEIVMYVQAYHVSVLRDWLQVERKKYTGTSLSSKLLSLKQKVLHKNDVVLLFV
jgi:hypothetical protein